MGTICNAWYRGSAWDCSEWSRPLSRLLVLMTTLLLLVMPVTEHLCNWDHFLRGGPDVEFSLLAGLLFAAMVVLSMNGTMLRPVVMQPGMPAPVSTAASQSTALHLGRAREASGRDLRGKSIPLPMAG